ncbi:MAG TPA: DUF3899 domain-containing protein [Haploplasma sp.]|nr:DUF3899 domain-containing protein [Haploplasma sp.]
MKGLLVMWNMLKKLLIYTGIGAIITLLILLFQNKYTLVAWANATAITGVIFLATGWASIVLNEGLFDLIGYSVTSFWGTLFGKRKEKSYYETRVEKVKIEKSVYYTYWLAALPFIVVSIILHIIYFI